MKIRKIIREILESKFLSEDTGVQLDIKELSKLMTNWIIENLSLYLNKDEYKDGFSLQIYYPTKISDEIISNIGIEKFKVNTNIEVGSGEGVGGKFISKKTTRLDKGFYVELELNIKLNNLKDLINLKNNINSLLNHELNHALVFVKQYDNQKSRINYNNINKKLSFEYSSNPVLFEFIKMMYLTMPEEIQARVQETGSLLDKIEVGNYHDAIRELYRFQAINDASRMMKYKVDKVSSLDQNIINDFLKSISLNDNSLKIGQINNPNLFFGKWEKDINKGGYELNKKILKLVANKFNKEDDLLKEGDYNFSSAMNYISKDDDLFRSIFGFGLDDWE